METSLQKKMGDTLVELIQGDISDQQTDAVVNAANRNLEPGSGVSGAIHSVAGPKLFEACSEHTPLETGQVVLTPGFDLPNKFVIHTVGPFYASGGPAEAALLERCYENSLNLAEGKEITSIAFPAISTGIFGYPKKEAAEVAFTAIDKYLRKNSSIRLIRVVVFDLSSFVIHKRAFKRIFHIR